MSQIYLLYTILSGVDYFEDFIFFLENQTHLFAFLTLLLSPQQPVSLKVKVIVKVTQLCLTLCDPMDYIVHGVLQARTLKYMAVPFSRGSSQPRDWTQVSHIAGGFFTGQATGKLKNPGVGSLCLLQWIFPTQELNRGLLQCRRILDQLSSQGSPLDIYIGHNLWVWETWRF